MSHFKAYETKLFGYNIYDILTYIDSSSVKTRITLIGNQNTSLIPNIGDNVSFTFNSITFSGILQSSDLYKSTVGEDSNGVYTEIRNKRIYDEPISEIYIYVLNIIKNTNQFENFIDPVIGQPIKPIDFGMSAFDEYRNSAYDYIKLRVGDSEIPSNDREYNWGISIDGISMSSTLIPIVRASSNPVERSENIFYYRYDIKNNSFVTAPIINLTLFKSESSTSYNSSIVTQGSVVSNSNEQASTTSSLPSSPSPAAETTPSVTLPVYPVKYFGCYVSNFDVSLTTAGEGKLGLYLYEDPSQNSTFAPPIIGSDFSFLFDGMIFKGLVNRYQQLNSITQDIKKYFVEIDCYEGVSNFSDTIFGKTVISFNASVSPSQTRLDSNQSNINVTTYVTSATNPSSSYGTTFAWNSSSAQYFSIGGVVYTGSKSYDGGLYEITGNKPISLSQVVVKSATSTPSNASSVPGTTLSTTSNGITTVSSVNGFGAGTVTTTAPNTANQPIGTTTSTVIDGGLTKITTTTVTETEVITVVNSSFTSTPNTSAFATQQRQAANIPQDFQGSIDPIALYPSVEVYGSGKYSSQESGRFFGKSATPTSHDLDPYFYFNQNDYSIVAKDGKSNTTDVNVKKDGIKDHVRTMGLKLPMYFSGWGYDHRGLPVPNASGLVSSGEYKFHPNTSKNRGLWKTGPVDLRWHDKKKTWVGGHEMLEGYLTEDLEAPNNNNSSTTAKMSVLRVATGSGLKNLNQEYITITNRDPSLASTSGTYCIALDINYEWRPIYIGC